MNKREFNRIVDQAGKYDLRDIVAPLFRHKRTAVAAFSATFGLASVVAWVWAANYYVSTMQVLVEQDRSDPAVSSGLIATIQNNKAVTVDQVSSEIALLQGTDMLRTVVETCGLDGPPTVVNKLFQQDPKIAHAMDVEAATQSLSRRLKVDAATTSDVIEVKYGGMGDPKIPACVLQNLGRLYLEKHLHLRRPAGSADFFAAETEKYRAALADSEWQLTNFSRQEEIGAPDVLRADMAQQLANAQGALYQAHEAIAADEKRLEDEKAQMQITPARASTIEESSSAFTLLQDLQNTLLAAQVKRTQLLLKFDPSYPLIREADQEIAQTEQAIAKAQNVTFVNRSTDRDSTYEFLRQDMAKTQADLATQKATAAALVDNIRSTRLEMVNLEQDVVKQGALIREAKANEANYLLYLNKREQERTADALDQRRIANVGIAVPAVVPVLPAHSPWLVMMLGFAFSIFTAFAAVFVAEYLDASFRTPSELKQELGIPVLASFPVHVA